MSCYFDRISLPGSGLVRTDIESVFVEMTQNIISKRRTLQTTSIDLAGTQELYDSANRLLGSAAKNIVTAQAGLATLNSLRRRLVSLLSEQEHSDEAAKMDERPTSSPSTSLSSWHTMTNSQYLQVRTQQSITASPHLTSPLSTSPYITYRHTSHIFIYHEDIVK
jgi:hypothetical protein